MRADRMSFVEQIMNKCRHFNGLINDRCKAGVAYASVKGPPDAKGLRGLPCLADEARGATCSSCAYRTREEAEAQERELHAASERMGKACAAIRASRLRSGVIPCPACGKPMGFGVASTNGHIHAQCETPGCVSFMQ